MKKALLKTASRISFDTVVKIKAKFEEYLKTELDWDVREDSSLLGGFVLYVDGTVYDSSVKTKLDDVKQALNNAVGGKTNE